MYKKVTDFTVLLHSDELFYFASIRKRRYHWYRHHRPVRSVYRCGVPCKRLLRIIFHHHVAFTRALSVVVSVCATDNRRACPQILPSSCLTTLPKHAMRPQVPGHPSVDASGRADAKPLDISWPTETVPRFLRLNPSSVLCVVKRTSTRR